METNGRMDRREIDLDRTYCARRLSSIVKGRVFPGAQDRSIGLISSRGESRKRAGERQVLGKEKQAARAMQIVKFIIGNSLEINKQAAVAIDTRGRVFRGRPRQRSTLFSKGIVDGGSFRERNSPSPWTKKSIHTVHQFHLQLHYFAVNTIIPKSTSITL